MQKKLLVLGMALITLAACEKPAGTQTDPYSTSSASSVTAMEQSASSSTAATTSTPASTPSSSATMTKSSKAGAWTWDGTNVSGKHTVMLKTSKGDITVELNADVAPKTVTSFMALASSGYYNGLTFHRVIPGFMIQGGDPNGNGTGGRSIFGETFEDEIDASSDLYSSGYQTGVIAMANRGPNTNGSQFFIMDADYPLPPNYTIFGHVTAGQNVVHDIATVARDPSDMPKTPVTFSVTIVK